jgi:hypothetical protein
VVRPHLGCTMGILKRFGLGRKEKKKTLVTTYKALTAQFTC